MIFPQYTSAVKLENSIICLDRHEGPSEYVCVYVYNYILNIFGNFIEKCIFKYVVFIVQK